MNSTAKPRPRLRPADRRAGTQGRHGHWQNGPDFQAGKHAILDVSAQAYTGKRDGVMGSLRLKIAF
jgi:hypothetical protein